jgi:ficolin
MKFSTWDQDNDNSATVSCALSYKGGWWYNKCHASNPNGLYLAGQNAEHARGITCADWKGQGYSLKEIKIMVRRKRNIDEVYVSSSTNELFGQ